MSNTKEQSLIDQYNISPYVEALTEIGALCREIMAKANENPKDESLVDQAILANQIAEIILQESR